MNSFESNKLNKLEHVLGGTDIIIEDGELLVEIIEENSEI